MLDFKPIAITDKPVIESFLLSSEELSCEANFVTLMVWQAVYGTRFAVDGDCMLIRMTGGEGGCAYSLPFGNFERGMQLIFAQTDKPRFWIQEGKRCLKFTEDYAQRYIIKESRDAFDYLYLRQDLAELSGKKYQAKRNHISAFSRSYDWKFEPVCDGNIDAVRQCARQWYAENRADDDKYLRAERDGVALLLDNMSTLGIVGGAIMVDGKAVAFSLGSQINSEIFNVHIEKALTEYATAYAVINRELARYADGYRYFNREDDMGIEGLRKAKMSYRPTRLIRKFRCDMKLPVREQCFNIYRSAFGNSGEFDERLFELFFDCCEYTELENGVAAMLFALPCTLHTNGKSYPCRYIYAAATAENMRSQGHMTRLLEGLDGILLLKPATESLIGYYEKRGFSSINAIYSNAGESFIEVDSRFVALAGEGRLDSGSYTAMIKSDIPISCKSLSFAYTME